VEYEYCDLNFCFNLIVYMQHWKSDTVFYSFLDLESLSQIKVKTSNMEHDDDSSVYILSKIVAWSAISTKTNNLGRTSLEIIGKMIKDNDKNSYFKN